MSIVIPAFNAEPYLSEAVESALAQTHPSIEVVVVDDGSTDGTQDVIRGFGHRIRSARKANGGTASARNVGARMATGEFVVFLDADDRLLPTYVERCLAHLAAHPEVGYVYTQERFFGDLDRMSDYPPFDSRRLVLANFVNPSALLRRSDVLATLYNEKQRTHEDWDFYLGLLKRGITGALLDESLKEYRRHPGAKQALAGKYQLRMPIARLRIHVRHRDLLGRAAPAVLVRDVARVVRGAVRGGRTAVSLWVRRADR